MSAAELVADLWRQQSLWSRTADRMKRRISRARTAALAVTVTVAVLAALAGVLAAEVPVASRVLAVAAAFGAALLPRLRPAWSGRALRDWTRARSVSEALKSEVFLWLAKAGPYRGDPDGVGLLERSNQLRDVGGDLLRHQAGVTPDQRPTPDVHDVPSYFEARVSDQIHTYYRPRAAELQKALRRFRAVELGLAVLAAAIGAVAAVLGGSEWTVWIAVVTTIGAALAVHVAAARHEYQLIEFLHTAQRLEVLSARASTESTADGLDALAVAAEQVISIENEAWMAKLAEDPPDHRAKDTA
ncbi:DUF4231 domain-containing protein [Kutzneria sp. NPDC052558]|uniref:DUF4231 domain-containing protein n=1 Tax=Kutzneria sp. NPDC052558 TaxID=3364121 RepID=UPI0037C7909F